MLEFIKPNYHKLQKKKTGSGSEADQALSLTTNLRRDSRVVSLHNWRYFLAFFRWAEASAKRARSARHAPSPVARVRCSVQTRPAASLAHACLKNARKIWWTEHFHSWFFFSHTNSVTLRNTTSSEQQYSQTLANIIFYIPNIYL